MNKSVYWLRGVTYKVLVFLCKAHNVSRGEGNALSAG